LVISTGVLIAIGSFPYPRAVVELPNWLSDRFQFTGNKQSQPDKAGWLCFILSLPDRSAE
jgi:hypothetical protein